MRKFTAAVLLLTASSILAAHGHHSSINVKETLKKMSKHGPVIAQPAVINPKATTKVFNIVAVTFQFNITPSPFVVEKGDTVVLNVSVPANDSSPSGHGILMESYIENLVNVNKGQTRQITFVATTSGDFAFICSQSTCGIGHSSMFGTLTVNEVTVPTPTVTAIAPASGSIKGATAVTITGTNFSSDSTVKIGGVAATNVVFVNATTITAKTSKHAAGLVDVEVTNGGTSGKKTGAFTYTADPVKKWTTTKQP